MVNTTSSWFLGKLMLAFMLYGNPALASTQHAINAVIGDSSWVGFSPK